MGQLGLQRIAAGGSAMLELLRRGSLSEDGASDNSGLLSQRRKLRVCGATSCCRPTGVFQLFDEDLGNRATLFIFPTAIQYTDVRIDGPRGGELGLFQFLKQSKATLTYAMLVSHQFTNRITKLPTQAKRDKQSKA